MGTAADTRAAAKEAIMQNNKENARPNAATSERVKGEISIAAKISPHEQYIPEREKSQVIVSDFLCMGAENAIHAKELARLVGCSTPRQLQHLVAQERRSGTLILSDTKGGYYLPDTGIKGRNEIARYVGAMSRRAARICAVTEGARQALNVLYGQEEIQGVE